MKAFRPIASLIAVTVLLGAPLASRFIERVLAAESPKQASGAAGPDWPVYNGNASGDHYSSLSQINRGNVAKLQVAWKFDTGEMGGLQANPIIVGRVLYAYTPSQKVIALDAATGALLWKFDSGINGTQPARGVTYWSDGTQARIFAGVMNYLYALDAATGKPIAAFGEGGRIDLRKGLGKDQDYQQQSIALTTPGIIYKDLIIVGGRNPETHPAPPGDIRAFDVHNGALRWSFHTIPHPGETGYDTWPKDAWLTAGAANNWAGMSLDAARGIVYVPTGSAVFDFYGDDRIGNDLFANTLLALDAATGKRLWHFQGVHHDIWDRDFPAAPALVTVNRDGHPVDAIAQTTKQGVVYLFDRSSGAPLFPIEEHAYPASTVPGETASPTQPMPLLPEPFARQRLTEDMLTTRTPQAHAWALAQFKTFRSDGQFVPLIVGGQTIVMPGFDGGAEWGGPAVDPSTGVLYVNSNDIAWTGGLEENQATGGVGAEAYRSQCAICHRADLSGSPPAFPSLIGVDKRMTDQQIVALIHSGKGRMQAYPALTGDRLAALLQYVKAPPLTVAGAGPSHSDKTELPSASARVTPSAGAAKEYSFTGYRKFLDPDGYPAIVPPWGTLNAIDLNTGKYLWKVPLGEYPALAAQGIKKTGTENYGGPIVTAGGLLFIGATIYDHKLRAFDSATGQLLWQTELPFGGVATPSTYAIDGKQYVVIATSSAREPNSPQGGAYVAFTLP